MKVGVVGKGVTGKTTVCALLCQAYVSRGRRVVAVDTDFNPNLALSLGLDEHTALHAPLVPRSLVVGRGGDLLPARVLADYGVETPAGVTLLHAMRVKQAGAGCSCADHANVRSLLGTALEDEADLTLVDMEAGLEHLSRSGGTLAYADVLLVVMEPSRKSVITAARTMALADELGIPQVFAVGNKARPPDDARFFEELAAEYGLRLAGVLPHDPEVATADRQGHMLRGGSEDLRRAIDQVVDRLEDPGAQREALLRQRDELDRRLAQLSGSA